MTRWIRPPFRVPFHSQFASADLISEFIEGGRPLESDPAWADYGAQSPAEYAHWSLRSCGVICVQMAVEGLSPGSNHRSAMSWVRAGLDIDGYLVELRADRPDKPVEKGWKHLALAELMIQAGLYAELVSLPLSDIPAQIEAGRLLIASVSSEIGRAEAPITRKGGHLVLVLGVEVDEAGRPLVIELHNPSGRSELLRTAAHIEAERFDAAYAGRGIVVAKSPSGL